LAFYVPGVAFDEFLKWVIDDRELLDGALTLEQLVLLLMPLSAIGFAWYSGLVAGAILSREQGLPGESLFRAWSLQLWPLALAALLYHALYSSVYLMDATLSLVVPDDFLFLPIIIIELLLTVRLAILNQVVMLEPVGIRQAFARTLFLTRGRGWKIFISYVLILIPGMALMALVFVYLGMTTPANFERHAGSTTLTVAYSAVGAVMTVSTAVFGAVLYQELKLLKEGAAAQTEGAAEAAPS
jgi:hypothetical protein